MTVNKWWLHDSCADCGAEGRVECDESCPSALAAYIAEFEADIEEAERMPADLQRAAS